MSSDDLGSRELESKQSSQQNKNDLIVACVGREYSEFLRTVKLSLQSSDLVSTFSNGLFHNNLTKQEEFISNNKKSDNPKYRILGCMGVLRGKPRQNKYGKIIHLWENNSLGFNLLLENSLWKSTLYQPVRISVSHACYGDPWHVHQVIEATEKAMDAIKIAEGEESKESESLNLILKKIFKFNFEKNI